MRFKLGNFLLTKEKVGVISENEIWVIIYSCWFYTDESLLKCIWKFLTEFKHDRHLVG